MGAFQGKLNPLSSRSIILFETCDIPIMLYGCENWFLTEVVLQWLKAFQGELGRRILHSTLAIGIALDWSSVTARILSKKLSLLHKICSNQDSIGHRFYLSISAASSQPLQFTQTCYSLESKLDCVGLSNKVLSRDFSDFGCFLGVKKFILEQNQAKSLTEASAHRSTCLASKVASQVSWLKLWDLALDFGGPGTSDLRALYRALTAPCFGPSPCQYCTVSNLESSYFDHFISSHSTLPNSDFVIKLLRSESSDIFVHAKCFSKPRFVPVSHSSSCLSHLYCISAYAPWA